MGKWLILTLVFLALVGCKDYGNTTPKKFKYKLHDAAKTRYLSDTTAIRQILIKMLNGEVKPFNLKAFDKGTELYIDSLVYSPDQLRMVVFVIAKNSTMKLLRRENDSLYYYNAYYLFSARDSLGDPIKIYDRAGFGLINFYDVTEIRRALREYCFNRLLRLEGTEQHYNIDDIRFWRSMDFELVLSHSFPTSQ